MIGSRLGHFEIEAKAGAGGMGEVYRARDTRLDRTVAIKVLPAELAADPQRRERLKREAMAISRLNHPHVCTLFDIGHEVLTRDDGGDGDGAGPGAGGSGEAVDYLVLEYLDGTPLSERVSAGALSLAEALRIAAQIADGLDAAHRLGIVHRDLKPANVMLTPGGAKLLDFGLAKEHAGPAAAGTMIATQTVSGSGSGAANSITAEGTILGTLQYMSPEQLHGEAADARSDLFSFGAMLYEMVTGVAPFAGKSQASVIASILEKTPEPVSAHVSIAPKALERLVTRCLAKNPEERWQNARDLLHELRWIASGAAAEEQEGLLADGTGAGGSSAGWPQSRVLTVAGLAAVVALLLGALLGPKILGSGSAGTNGTASTLTGGATQPMVRAVLPLPEGYRVSGWASPTVAISDDGSTVAFVAEQISGELNKRLFVRPLDAFEATLVPDSDFAEGPVFSPDGRWVLFAVAVSGGARNTPPELRKYSLDSGLTQTVCPVRDYFGADWHPDGTIVWSGQIPKGLWRIHADRGDKENFLPMFRSDGTEQAMAVGWPQFLPDGNRMLVSTVSGGVFGRGAILDLRSGELTHLVANSTGMILLPDGRVAWVDAAGTVMTAPFDMESGQLTGAPRAVDRDVSVGGASRSVLAVAGNGTAVLTRGPILGSGRNSRRVIRVGADGLRMEPGIDPGFYRSMAVSRDGTRLALISESTLRIHDVNTGARTDLPRGNISASSFTMEWSPDDRWVAYRGFEAGSSSLDIYVSPSDGSGSPRMVFDAESEAVVVSWEADGSAILVADFATDGTERMQLKRVPVTLDGSRPPAEGSRVELGNYSGLPRLDPTGELIAYLEPQGGSYGAFVRSYPDLGPALALGNGAYSAVVWGADGSSLYLFDGDVVREFSVTRSPTLVVQPVGTVMDGVEHYHRPSINPGTLGGFWVLEDLPGEGVVTELEVISNWVQNLP